MSSTTKNEHSFSQAELLQTRVADLGQINLLQRERMQDDNHIINAYHDVFSITPQEAKSLQTAKTIIDRLLALDIVQPKNQNQ